MKPLYVNGKAEIIEGVLKGFKGKIIAFDSLVDEAILQLDSVTFVTTHSENLLQEGESTQLSLDLKDINLDQTEYQVYSFAVNERDWNDLK